jgi:hypothetical protein
MKSTYWTCSKFADWLRGVPKPAAGTAEEWNAWKKIAKAKKFRYWLTEDGLDYLQRFVYWPANRINNMKHYIDNRWITKSHTLTSNLKRGKWYDFDTRLLHAVFDELVNFVEIELAWKWVVCSTEERKKYKMPEYRSIFRIGLWRCPAAGIAYVNWAAELKNDENWMDKNDPSFGQPSPQALAAQKTLLLYNWWKTERPNRLDPSEASGWSDYCEENFTAAEARGDDPLFSNFITHEDGHSRHILDTYHKLEKEQKEEDTAMLIRLIKLRQSLWA